jgi:hypothetical protein
MMHFEIRDVTIAEFRQLVNELQSVKADLYENLPVRDVVISLTDEQMHCDMPDTQWKKEHCRHYLHQFPEGSTGMQQ